MDDSSQKVRYDAADRVIAGIDEFFARLRPRLEARRVRYSYEELDPDVFGEELDTPAYAHVDRIAVVALTVDIR